MKTLLAQSILVLGTSSLLISCMGQSSNPMKKYSDLRSGLPTTEQSEAQKFVPGVFTTAQIPDSVADVSQFLIPGVQEVNSTNFKEGQEGILYFKLAPKSPKITLYKLEITDFSSSSRPILVAAKQDHLHGLRWTPPIGIIPSNKPNVTLKIQILTKVIAATDPNLIGLASSDSINIFVTKDTSVPKLFLRTNLDAGVDEGQKAISYIIDVDDPSSINYPKAPSVRIDSYVYSNTEAFRANGYRYLQLDESKSVNPERVSGKPSTWRFHYLLNVDELPLDRNRLGAENPLAPSVDVCFLVSAMGALNVSSIQEQVCFQGRYAAQPAVLQWENDAIKEIKAGVPTTLKFKISSPNGLGEVNIKNAASQISNLTGNKDLVCTFEGENKSAKQCELTWKPACIATALNKKLTLKVESATGKKSKTQSFSKDFVVTPDEDNCPKPTPKPKAAPAKAKKGAKQ